MKRVAALTFLFAMFAGPAKSEWAQTNLDGGYAYDVAATKKTMFAITGSGGVFRSGMDNVEWIYMFGAGYDGRSVHTSGDTVFVVGGNGVHMSTDEGENWLRIHGGDIRSYFRSKNIIAYGFEYNGGRVSMDGGQSWIDLDFNIKNQDEAIAHICATGPDRIFAAAPLIDGFFLSRDSGTTWEEVEIPPPANYVQNFFVMGDTIFAGMYGVCISIDRGETWDRIDDLEGKAVLSFAHSPSGYLFAATHDSAVFRSEDNGATWSRLENSPATVSTIEVNADGVVFATLVAEKSIMRSLDNGETWEAASTGLRCDDNLVVSANSKGEILAGGSYGVFKSDDHGQSWSNVAAGLYEKENPLIRDFAVLDSEIVAVAGRIHGILRSVDNGDSWDTIGSGSLSENFNPDQAGITDSGHIVVSTLTEGVIMSKDRGTDWSRINDVSYVDVVYVHGNDIFIGDYSTNYASEIRGDLLRYSGRGKEWTLVKSWAEGIDDILFANGFLFVATSTASDGGLYRSSDQGATWTSVNSSYVAKNITSLIASDSLLFAGTTLYGVFMSKDSGQTWIDVNGALSERWSVSEMHNNMRVRSLAVADGYLYASIVGGSVWRRPLAELASTQKVGHHVNRDATSDHFRVVGSGNGLIKTVRLQLAHPQKTSVRVYGLNGALRMVLVDQYLAQGSHVFRWNTSRLSPGFYVMTMQCGHKRMSRLVQTCAITD